MFDLILAAEVIFTQTQHTFLAAQNNISESLVREMCNKTSDMTFVECHGIKQKLIECFVSARLQFFAKKERNLRKAHTPQVSCHELSSKSTQMRKSVSKLK